MSNSDPITGQAAWYDVRVRVYPAESDADRTLPQFPAMNALPGANGAVSRVVQTYFAGRGEFLARPRAEQAATVHDDGVHAFPSGSHAPGNLSGHIGRG